MDVIKAVVNGVKDGMIPGAEYVSNLGRIVFDKGIVDKYFNGKRDIHAVQVSYYFGSFDLSDIEVYTKTRFGVTVIKQRGEDHPGVLGLFSDLFWDQLADKIKH